MRDLISHKKLLERGQLCNLSFKHDDFWSKKRIDEHYQLCVEKGGSERGRMVGTAKDEHRKKCEKSGGSERGAMAEGTAKDAHTKRCMKGDAGIHLPIWSWDMRRRMPYCFNLQTAS